MSGFAIRRNEVVRFLMLSLLPVLNGFFTARMASRIAKFTRRQESLRLAYGITDTTPIRGYDIETENNIRTVASRHRDSRFATTSGTTGHPKKIVYTEQRLRQYKADFRACGVLCFQRFRVERPTIFILANLTRDDSFSSYVLNDRGQGPGYFTGLVEPGRYLMQDEMLRQVEHYGATAARLWLMALSDPGVLYATNPSTIAAFFADLYDQWQESSAMIRAFCENPDEFLDLKPIVRRLCATGYEHRMQLIAGSDSAPDIGEILPRLSAWCSWDGGYVTPFIRRVEHYLAPERVPHIPMFSMSTEVVQTLTCFDENGEICFLPLAPHVLYEFLPEHAEEQPENLIAANALQPGGVYAMVVSDDYGLVRYRTDDLFECRRLVKGLPDLRFLRRRGLAYSFTGEKLTGSQLLKAFAGLRREIPGLTNAGIQLCCFPSCADNNRPPAYRLVLVLPPGLNNITVPESDLGQSFEKILATLNHEFADKRRSGRLARTRVTTVRYQWLATALDARTTTAQDITRRAWESQFKLAPLYPVLWESVAKKLPLPLNLSSSPRKH